MATPTGFKFFPMPIHSVLLFVVWLLMNNTLAAGHIFLALILSITIPWLLAGLQSAHPPIRKPWLAVRYSLMVIMDIVTANFEVALKVIGPMAKLQPGFIAVHLDISSDLGITLLASTVSLTPGTVSAEVSEDKKWLYIHALHLENEQALIDSIKQRYEKPLLEILGC